MRLNFRKTGFLLIILSCVFMGGCWDAMELDSQAYVINMAIDSYEELLLITTEVPSMAAESGSSGSSGEQSSGEEQASRDQNAEKISQSLVQDGYLLAQSKGKSLFMAMDIQNSTSPRKLSYVNLQNIIISEELAKTPKIYDILRQLKDIPEIRSTARVIVCEGSAGEFIKNQKVSIGSRLPKSMQAMLDAYVSEGHIPASTLDDVVKEMASFYNDPVVAFAALNFFDDMDGFISESNDEGKSGEGSKGEGDKGGTSGDAKEKSGDEAEPTMADADTESNASGKPGMYYAGEIPRIGTNRTEYFGSAALTRNGMTAKFTGYETQLISLVTGTFRESLFAAENDEGTAEMWVSVRKSPRVNVVAGDAARIYVEVNLEAEIEDAYSIEHSEERLIECVQNSIQKDLITLIEKCGNKGVDPFGFAGYSVRSFWTVDEWENYRWVERFKDAEIVVSVQINPVYP